MIALFADEATFIQSCLDHQEEVFNRLKLAILMNAFEMRRMELVGKDQERRYKEALARFDDHTKEMQK